jgi:hypothetical protein
MFYRLGDGSIRLYRPGDDCDPDRSGKTHPDRSEIPPAYHPLIDWYEKEYCGDAPAEAGDDPILSLRGLGKGIWSNIDPDEYIRELRADWSDETAHTGAVGAAERESFAREPRDDRLWERIIRFQGEQFKTSTGLPFTYEVEGNSGVWFYREGERIDRRVWRGEIESAWKNTPLQSPSGLRKFQCSSYLYGLLTDARIIAGERG